MKKEVLEILADADEVLELIGDKDDSIVLENNLPYYTNKNYEVLRNLPSINGVKLIGNKQANDLFLAKESIHTTEYWRLHQTYVPASGEIVIYTDREVVDGKRYAGLKIGDGNAYIVDLPFIGDSLIERIWDALNEHINNQTIHVTQEEKDFWNDKINCDVDVFEEELILTRL